MKIGAVIQARASSTRLPRKVFKELPYGSGITVLQQVIRRLKKADDVHEIIVATTTEEEDREISQIARKENVKCFRGSLNHVLERYYLAAKENNLDIVVRITGDCPCVDPDLVDLVVARHKEGKADYTSNVVKRTYPDGLDVEVFDFCTLEKAYRNARQDIEREHVTPYIYKNPDIFKIVHVEADEESYAPDRRITLDTAQDYVLLCAVFDELYPDNKYFGVRAIMKLFREKPWLDLINTKSHEISLKH